MIFAAPQPTAVLSAVIEMITALRGQLRGLVGEPRRWSGSLRRLARARAVQGSNSIEGYHASLDDVMAVIDDEVPLDTAEETQLALGGYRDAMTYVLQLARDDGSVVDESLIRALHFMMLKHDLTKNPGRWRPGSIRVEREPDGHTVYEGPDVELVPGLMAELVRSLNDPATSVLIEAALAHLNLAMIHPFSDGNGRMARCVQTLVLARQQILSPEFNSIEEYLGRNTQAYYDVLGLVGQGSWQPRGDTTPWFRFCLTAHYRQARTLVRRYDESGRIWDGLTKLAAQHKVPERSIAALFDAALGLRVRNGMYRKSVESSTGEQISDLTASRDLRSLVEARLLEPHGERRTRIYTAAPITRAVGEAVRSSRRPPGEDDPFVIVAHRN